MPVNRILFALSALVLPLASSLGRAQEVAIPPLIKMVVPFAAGGSTDIMARALARELEPKLGATVIVENRAGAGSLLGSDAVAKGPRDGSMILFTTASLVTAVATAKRVPFDLTADLQPVAMIGEGPMVIAMPASTSVKTPADFVAAARARPDTLTYGSAGVGTIGHLTAELINDTTKISTRHVPYRGTAMALIDLANGTIDFTVGIYTTLAPQIDAGRVRLIAVTTREVSPAFPALLPMASTAAGFDASTWVAVFVPAGTPAPLVQRFNREINALSNAKSITDQMVADGMVGKPLTPEQLVPKVRATYDMWRRIAVEKKIVAE